MGKVHFIGIGGVGMNGLAQLAVKSEYSVTGSDRAYTPETDPFRSLEKMGIQIFPQDGSGIDQSTDQIVFSTAIEEDNADLIKARELNIPLLHRSDFLKQLVGDSELIAVAGTAGKTTTTGLLGWIFEQLGKDPSVYNGAAVLNWKTDDALGNVRKGRSDLWIIEADESDKSFLKFSPSHSIITNISKDHYELDELKSMFNRFEQQTSGITVHGPETSSTPDISMIGSHNLENAQCAFSLCTKLGLDQKNVLQAIREFKGIERRLEVVGTVNGITIIDDYAHNPAKISASLSTAAQNFKTVHAYWRPHGFSPLAQNLEAFVETFSTHWKKHQGFIYILPVYFAGGTVNKKVNSRTLIKLMNSASIPAQLVTDYAALRQNLVKNTSPGDVILGMGARDPELPVFARQLVTQWEMS